MHSHGSELQLAPAFLESYPEFVKAQHKCFYDLIS